MILMSEVFVIEDCGVCGWLWLAECVSQDISVNEVLSVSGWFDELGTRVGKG